MCVIEYAHLNASEEQQIDMLVREMLLLPPKWHGMLHVACLWSVWFSGTALSTSLSLYIYIYIYIYIYSCTICLLLAVMQILVGVYMRALSLVFIHPYVNPYICIFICINM
jgi:hypothetical protein